MHIIGTAGHVDHGKSSLVAALTGTNPDRWLEEQLRGMTLDLGFAKLAFENGDEAGMVDVPGHARFLHNMLAGAAGMELLLLVVAANEGIMPQTLEHMHILQYLNVRRVVVAMTKADLLAPEMVGERCAELHEALHGTIAQDAPIFAVSTVTGHNLDVLKRALQSELAQLEPRDPSAPVYLPVDRVFTLAGRGTVVTGTLMQGRIATGDELALAPSGKRVRARSLHVFGDARSEVLGGMRVAINLPNVTTDEIARGETVTDPRFAARNMFSVTFKPLDDALPLLKRRNAVRAHIGSAEILGTLVLDPLPAPGETVTGELFLKAPVLAFPGVRYVVRRVSPKTLLGGGEVASLGAGANEEAQNPAAAAVLAVLVQRGAEPTELSAIAFGANLREDAAKSALAELIDSGDVLAVAKPEAWIAKSVATGVLEGATERLRDLQSREPWVMGATSIALSRGMAIPESNVVRILAAFGEEGRIAHRSGYYSTTDHVPRLSAEQRAFFDEIAPLDPTQPHTPIEFGNVSELLKTSKIPGLAKAYDTLIARGVFVRVGDALYHGSQIQAIHQKLESFIAANERMTMAQFRDVLGTSRKYAVPLLEWFDSRGITVRSGDYRMLRSKKAV